MYVAPSIIAAIISEQTNIDTRWHSDGVLQLSWQGQNAPALLLLVSFTFDIWHFL